jgi:hypothetical protein
VREANPAPATKYTRFSRFLVDGYHGSLGGTPQVAQLWALTSLAGGNGFRLLDRARTVFATGDAINLGHVITWSGARRLPPRPPRLRRCDQRTAPATSCMRAFQYGIVIVAPRGSALCPSSSCTTATGDRALERQVLLTYVRSIGLREAYASRTPNDRAGDHSRPTHKCGRRGRLAVAFEPDGSALQKVEQVLVDLVLVGNW